MSTKELMQVEIGQAERLIGCNVLAVKAYWGSYYGRLLEVTKTAAMVEILAVAEYPSQHAIIFKDNIFIRRPYKYQSVCRFELSEISEYTGEVPGYRESVIKAIRKAMKELPGGRALAVLDQQLSEVM